MDMRTGEIVRDINDIPEKEKKHFKQVDAKNLPRQLVDEMGAHPERRKFNRKVGVNERCPCGSGKKFKKCCMEEL